MKRHVLFLLAALLGGVVAQAQVTEFPYTQSFETADLGGWTATDADADSYNWTRVTYTDAVGHDGTYFMISQSYDNNIGVLTPDNWLISPAIALEDSPMVLSWWTKVQDPNYPADHFGVFVSTTGNTPDDFGGEPLYEVTLSSAYADWVKTEVSLADYAGQTVYIAFRHYDCTDQYIFQLDEVTVAAPAACPLPTNLAVVPGTTSADVSFDYAENAVGALVYVDGELRGTATSGSYTVTGLEPGTNYGLAVRHVCADGDTSDMATLQFMTECVSISEFPYFMGFEEGKPNCWTFESQYLALTTSSHSGAQACYMNAGTSAFPLITPVIDVPADASNFRFEVWVAASGTSDTVKFKLYVSTTASTDLEEGFDEVLDTALTATGVYVPVYISLDPYAGQSVTIALQNNTTASQHSLYFDDFSVRSTNMPVISMAATGVADINVPATFGATLLEGDTTSLSWTWTSTMADAGNATMTPDGASVEMTYTATGFDTLTVSLDNGFGTVSATMVVTVRDLSPVTEFPYSCGFEEGQDATNWGFENGSNAWTVGAAAHNNGSAGLYISNDNGATNAYDIATTTWSYAFRALNISEPGDYAVSFDWMANGESTFDYLRAFIAPGTTTLTADVAGGIGTTSLPSEFIAIDGGAKLNLSSIWQTQQAVVNLAQGSWLLVFAWHNDGSMGSQPPAAIDNVHLMMLNCTAPTALTFDVVGTDTLAFHWTPGDAESQWLVEVGDSISETVTDTFFVAEGLTSNTMYSVKVRALCGDSDTSLAAAATMRTMRVMEPVTELPYTTGFDSADTDNNLWFVENGANGWFVGPAVHRDGDQALYISNNNGATNTYDIGTSTWSYAYRALSLPVGDYAVSYDWRAWGEDGYDYIRVFLAPATITLTADVAGGLSTTATPAGYIALDGGGKLNSDSTWTTRQETLTIDSAGLYILAFAWRNDGSMGAQPPAAIDNVVFAALTCPATSALAIDNVTTDSIAFHWSPRGEETEWAVNINDSIVVTVTDTFYVAEGLTAATSYAISVRAVCGDGDTSFASIATVRTECTDVAVPYLEDFEDESYMCWNILNYYTSTYTGIYSATSYATSGSHVYRFYPGHSNEPVFAVMPRFDALADKMVSFNVCGSSYVNVQVGTMASPYDTTTFVPLYTIGSIPSYTPAAHEVYFDADTTGNRYVAFRFGVNTSFGYSAYLDDVQVMVAPSCRRPQAVAVSDVTTSGATVDITDPTGVGSYHIVVLSGTDTVVNDTVGETSYVLTGLTMVTDYTVIVSSLCEDGTETMTTTTSFRTVYECPDSIALPWIENFDADEVEECWTSLDLDGNTVDNWTVTNGKARTGYNEDGEANDWFISPAIELPADASGLVVRYSVTGDSYVDDNTGMIMYYTHYQARISAGGTDTADFTYVLASDELADVSSTHCFSLAPFGGRTIRIAFIHDSYNDDGVIIDNVYVGNGTATDTPIGGEIPGEEPGTCQAPTNLHTIAVDATSATLDWTPGGNETGWELEVNGQTRAAANHPYVLSGLTAATQYSVRVRAVCSATSQSAWSTALSFTTTADTGGAGIAREGELSFRLFPNPASSEVQVESDGKVTVAVLDLNGRELLRTEEKTFSVESLAKGAYFVRITSDGGTAVRKLIVR